MKQMNNGNQKFSAYLWGIETELRETVRRISTRRFQHTYEELKLFEPPEFDTVSCGFQHTYEELKHGHERR